MGAFCFDFSEDKKSKNVHTSRFLKELILTYKLIN